MQYYHYCILVLFRNIEFRFMVELVIVILYFLYLNL